MRPRARTLPVSQSSSRRLPCSRSYAIEALWDHALARAVLGVHVRVLLGFQRHRARRHGIRDGRAGSVTVIPRFGGGLNLNVHYQRAV